MLFNSPVFLFIFLPCVIFLYYLAPSKLRTGLLLLFSIFFYTWGEGGLVLVMLTSTVCDYYCGQIIESGQRKAGLVLSLVVNLSLLFYFKYGEFAFQNLKFLSSQLGIDFHESTLFAEVALPLGISFYTFQTLSYTFDVYRGKISASRNFVQFATYVTFFPQLIAGPIVRYSEIAKQLSMRSHSLDRFAIGARRFIVGLSKKVILANSFGAIADASFGAAEGDLSMALAWIGLIAFAFQLLFDFEGYSDMAIGLGKIFGFDFPENFNFPYISRSMHEFWRRWHMTLSRWFRDYLYIPMRSSGLGRNRAGFSLLITFLAIGIWHGANMTFVLFGLLQGIAMAIERAVFRTGWRSSSEVISHLYLLLLIGIGLVIFRADSIPHAGSYYLTMMGYYGGGFEGVGEFLNRETFVLVVVAVLLSIPVIPVLRARIIKYISGNQKLMTMMAYSKIIALLVLLFLCLVWVSADNYHPYIYFKF